MAGPEHAPVDNAMLLRHVVQLEHGALFLLLPLLCGLICILLCSLLQTYIRDRNAFNVKRQVLRLRRLKLKRPWFPEQDELRCNAEQLATTQTSTVDSLNLVSRKQGRRASGLEHDLETCQQKLNNCHKENTKLQEELLQVYTIKSKFAELLKIEVEKSAGLEKEVKLFQSRAIAALSDRDRSILEIEGFQRKEDDMMEKITELQDRLDQITSEYTEEKSLCVDFQKDLEKCNEENDLYRKLVERFWRVREEAIGPCGAEKTQDRAAILLQDSEGFWSYGEMNKSLHDQAKQARDNLAMAQEEFQVCCASLADLQAQIEEENYARKQAEDALTHCRQKLSCLAELVDSELRQLSCAKMSLKEDVSLFLLEEKNWILSLPEAWQHLTNKEWTQSLDYGNSINGDETKLDIVQQNLEETSEADIRSSCSRVNFEVDESMKGSLEDDANIHLLENNGEVLPQKPESSVIEEDLVTESLNNAKDKNPAEVEHAVSVESQESTTTAVQDPRDKDLTQLEEAATANGILDESLGSDKTEAALVVSHKKDEPAENGGAEELVAGSLEELRLDDEAGSRDLVVVNHIPFVDDSKEALAQALQEKVAALVLLSQQEERHILESNTTLALESEIFSLKQKLLQVTSEKVNALMELARVHEECLKLQEQEKMFKQGLQYDRRFSSGHLSPVGDHGVTLDDDKNGVSFKSESPRKASVPGYLKDLWLRGPELGGRTRSLSHMLSLSRSKENDTVGIARLRVENASLRESLTSIRHLCKSANRLRLTIARVAAESSAQTESSIQAAVEAVDGVISEALHLKVALHSSLPVDDLGWNSIGSPLAGAREASGEEGSDGETNDDLDIVSFFGLEIVRMVLLAAQLQKRFLGQNV